MNREAGSIRRALPGDAPAIAKVFEASRTDALPYLPVLHSDQEDIRFFAGLIDTAVVWVAEEDAQIVALLVINGDFVDHLYVVPTHQGRGIGSRLLELAKSGSAGHLRLYTFQRNQRARSFYERRGFVAIEFGDGSGNEERLPDVLYEWSTDHQKRGSRPGDEAGTRALGRGEAE